MECNPGRNGLSLSKHTVTVTPVRKRREKEKEDTGMAARNQEKRVSRTTLSTKDGDLVSTTTPVRKTTTESAIPTFVCTVDKDHVLERVDKPGVNAAVAVKDIKEVSYHINTS